jgi:hypothetical protein
MENEGLPIFISAIIAALILGVMVIAGFIIHAFLMIGSGVA